MTAFVTAPALPLRRSDPLPCPAGVPAPRRAPQGPHRAVEVERPRPRPWRPCRGSSRGGWSGSARLSRSRRSRARPGANSRLMVESGDEAGGAPQRFRHRSHAAAACCAIHPHALRHLELYLRAAGSDLAGHDRRRRSPFCGLLRLLRRCALEPMVPCRAIFLGCEYCRKSESANGGHPPVKRRGWVGGSA